MAALKIDISCRLQHSIFLRVQLYNSIFVADCKVLVGRQILFLEFYNRDKGREVLNLTEKYKNKSAGNKEKARPAEREKENAVSGYWRWAQRGRIHPAG